MSHYSLKRSWFQGKIPMFRYTDLSHLFFLVSNIVEMTTLCMIQSESIFFENGHYIIKGPVEYSIRHWELDVKFAVVAYLVR